MQITGKVTKWGNSLGLRLNAEIAHSLGLESGSQVELSLDTTNHNLIIKPLKNTRNFFKYSEADLIRGMTKSDFQGDLLAQPLPNEIA